MTDLTQRAREVVIQTRTVYSIGEVLPTRREQDELFFLMSGNTRPIEALLERVLTIPLHFESQMCYATA